MTWDVDAQYEKAASILSKEDPPLFLAKVDADEESNKDLAAEFDVRSYPTIKILRYGGSVTQDYKGPRVADEIVEYVKKQSGPASSVVQSSENVTSHLDAKKIVIVSQPLHYILTRLRRERRDLSENLLWAFNRLAYFQSFLARSLRISQL